MTIKQITNARAFTFDLLLPMLRPTRSGQAAALCRPIFRRICVGNSAFHGTNVNGRLYRKKFTHPVMARGCPSSVRPCDAAAPNKSSELIPRIPESP